MRNYQTKRSGALVKDVDVSTMTVTGYFAKFDQLDSDGDILAKGAATKSINENGPDSGRPRIMHLLQHKTDRPLARPHILKEDNTGIYFESKIADTSYGLDAIKLYDSGVYNEHSYGFNILQSESQEKGNVITEIKLWEGSTVTWGANEDTPFLGFKSEGTPIEKAAQLMSRFDTLTKALRNGTYTDDTFERLEIEINQIATAIKSLLPQDESTEADELKAMESFYTNLKI